MFEINCIKLIFGYLYFSTITFTARGNYEDIVSLCKDNRTEHDIYFNLSIYIQLIVANKTYIHSMNE